MEKIAIELLFEKPAFDKRFILEILPLAPLSMVSSMPGSYYRSMREPTDCMIAGMLENVLGWHLDENDGKIRSTILKKIVKHYKSQYKIDLDYNDLSSEVNYFPVILHLLKIEKRIIPPAFSYDDYWTQHLKAADERHFNGSRNYDWRLEKYVTELKGTDGSARNEFFAKHTDKFPKYYSSPKRREHVVTDGAYKFLISSTNSIFDLLSTSLLQCETAYLGNSEGWVNINIGEEL